MANEKNLTVEEADIIFAIARCDMVRERVSRDLYYHRNTLRCKEKRIKEKTGLDPYKFYDLVELLDMAEEVG